MPPIECFFIPENGKTLKHTINSDFTLLETDNFLIRMEHNRDGGIVQTLDKESGKVFRITLKNGSSIQTNGLILRARISTFQNTLPSHQTPEK